jgi:hypothetical protein
MSNESIRKNFAILLENVYTNGYRAPELPVVGLDYNENTPDDADPTSTLTNILNDILVAAPNNQEIQELVSKAKQLANNQDGVTNTGLVQQPIEDVPKLEMSENIGEINPTAPIITNGETTPWECQRSDEYDCRDDTSTEIASLLVTIGHILQNARLIPSKFDVPMIIKYINNTFASQTPQDMNALYESLNLDEGKIGKGLAALGLSAASMFSGGNAQASDVNNLQKKNQTSNVETTLDIKTNIAIRSNAYKVANFLLRNNNDKEKINDIVNILIPVAINVLSNQLTVEKANTILTQKLQLDDSGKKIVNVYLNSLKKLS